MGRTGARLYGEHTASQATEIGTTFFDDPDAVTDLAAAHEELADAALYSHVAADLIDRLATRWVDLVSRTSS
jgi:hypothetical protein